MSHGPPQWWGGVYIRSGAKGRPVLGSFPDRDFDDPAPSEGARGFQPLGKVSGQVFGRGVPAAKGGVVVDVLVIELLGDGLESVGESAAIFAAASSAIWSTRSACVCCLVREVAIGRTPNNKRGGWDTRSDACVPRYFGPQGLARAGG